MDDNWYCLRPTFYTSKPVTKFILALDVGHVAGMHFKQTWRLIHNAIAYAERKLGTDTWRSFRVHIHFTRNTTKDQYDLYDFLEKIGAIQNFNIPPHPVVKKQGMDAALTQDTMEVGKREVYGTMQEVRQRLSIFDCNTELIKTQYTVQLRADTDGTRESASNIIQADIPIQTVVTRHRSGDFSFDQFTPWAKSIQRILDATYIIDMGYATSQNYEDYRFLYRAWITTKPLKVTTKDGIELVRFDDLVKQTRTLKERFLG